MISNQLKINLSFLKLKCSYYGKIWSKLKSMYNHFVKKMFYSSFHEIYFHLVTLHYMWIDNHSRLLETHYVLNSWMYLFLKGALLVRNRFISEITYGYYSVFLQSPKFFILPDINLIPERLNFRAFYSGYPKYTYNLTGFLFTLLLTSSETDVICKMLIPSMKLICWIFCRVLLVLFKIDIFIPNEKFTPITIYLLLI